ncbi:hypothetical protein QJS04_geneDACA005417 [Acorus gramineus]|uniref:C2 domain-containing protein n=1 Tax=Acorus gramineus TaxID=55184 RepID=A0AAV9A5M9_ACOGR|nr:hypothetical protein QJS04_geneDACA005417 [Acorus gramineus]
MKPPPQPPPTLRKLVVEVKDARDLVPKDGYGTSSAYVVVDFCSQRKRTSTAIRTLNPEWKERLEFAVPKPCEMDLEELNVEVYNDKHFCGGGNKNHFLGRVRIYGSQFAKKGQEGLVYFPLERKSFFSWIRGDIGLKIYYFDEPIEKEEDPPPVEAAPVPEPAPPPPAVEVPAPTETARMTQTQAESRRVNGEFTPRVISGRFSGEGGERTPHPTTYDLVEPMQYLFVRVVKARGLAMVACGCEAPYVKVRCGGHVVRSRPSIARAEAVGGAEWNQVFAINYSRPELAGPTLELSIWDGRSDTFLGGVCFDLTDVPVRDQPDSALAPQWYRLEGGAAAENQCHPVSGEIMVSVWIGTQADDAFPESWSSDSPCIAYTRSKVYQSPKLWYLRVTIIEAQDLRAVGSAQPTDVRVKAQLGFQSARTRRSNSNRSSAVFAWHEDLMFVASEPLDDHLILLIEERSMKEPGLLGHALVALGSIEQRLDERPLPSKWYNLEATVAFGDGANSSYCGRLHVRLCLEGGYHVLDEAAHVCSDYRPTAKQLWKPPVGVLELGILGARGLLPMKTKLGGTKGSTDAYVVAKYGKKWVRTRTIIDSFDPRWNEQYTWQVYDPCTALTIGVFDNWRIFTDTADKKPDYRIGKVRVRVSTLESNRVYTNSYPLVVVLRSGVKKMGEIEVALRFTCPALLPDTLALYSQPMLPRMHYVRPIGVAQQEALRAAAARLVATWLARSEPPLGAEVVRYMLDADASSWSMRRAKANWFRIVGVLAWVVGLARWFDGIRRWKSPVTTVLVHALYLVLVWYPELAVPTASLYVFMMGAWYYRFRPKAPAGMDVRLSQADTADLDELDEEFDGFPNARATDVVRERYDRLRTLGARVQTLLGDIAAQGERAQALVSWRDPRATKIFIGACLCVAVVLYAVPAKMVAVAAGFYWLRHPMFRDPMPPAALNFFRRLPSLSDRLL